MANEKIILDKRSKKKDGTYPIKIYLRHNREILIATGYSCEESEFANGLLSKRHDNYKVKNAKLKSMLSMVEMEMISMSASGKLEDMTDKELKSHLQDKLFGKVSDSLKEKKKRFADFLNEFLETKTNAGTIRTYITTRYNIEAYDPNCTFDTMDKNWLMSFDKWMASRGLSVNYRAFNFRNIRSVFNYAIDNDYTTLYPFRKFKIKQEETYKRSMNIDQLRKLMNYECEEHQKKYRDLFMLMFYLIGINAGDLLTLKHENLYNGRIEYHRMKTNKYYSIKVEPEAMEIIERYKGEEYLLSFMDGNKTYKDILKQMNNQLKLIGKVERKGLGGKKTREPEFPEISSYWSRHTWATIAADLDIPVETISMALGHKAGYKITNVYIKFNHKKIDEANRKVIDHLLGIKGEKDM
ncbi:tyrosine-type recombinase/integrase [Parabacteroides hominis]|uniref:Site-specific integrase n=1 Tax=Parabacteroides hominis TaxID=2763057 RepID=A0ABR7DKX1_9BACT|nr:site-specific integrase [Parabacteroides hominis]MBC5632070.1 site-specific integrase [Parabacteroides hominis]